MIDFSIFTTAEAWISLVTLIFLEIVLGVDNIVFISITSDRLPKEKQHLGRKIGLAGAMVSRCIFLCFASFLVHMTTPLFTLDLGFYTHPVNVRDIVLFAGGAYLVVKGIAEIRSMLALEEEKAAIDTAAGNPRQLTIPRAVGTIMVMDIVFSIDSVITAVGLAEHLIVMILAVVIAIIFMMIFIDIVSDFINDHYEMKVLALVFITAIGVLLVTEALGIETGIELLDMPLEKVAVYFAMVFSIIIQAIEIVYSSRLKAFHEEHKEALEAIRITREEEENAALAARAALEEAKEAFENLEEPRPSHGAKVWPTQFENSEEKAE